MRSGYGTITSLLSVAPLILRNARCWYANDQLILHSSRRPDGGDDCGSKNILASQIGHGRDQTISRRHITSGLLCIGKEHIISFRTALHRWWLFIRHVSLANKTTRLFFPRFIYSRTGSLAYKGVNREDGRPRSPAAAGWRERRADRWRRAGVSRHQYAAQ